MKLDSETKNNIKNKYHISHIILFRDYTVMQNTFQKKDNSLPENFDWIAYRSLNKDLHFIKTRSEAIKHYKQHGYYQNRRFSFEETEQNNNHPIIAKLQLNDNLQPEIVNKYDNITHGVPENFNWIAYKALNKDVPGINTYLDAVKHYKEHGEKNNRRYSYQDNVLVPTTDKSINNNIDIEQLIKINKFAMAELNQKNGVPSDFDWIVYRSHNRDLSHIKSYYEAVRHYREHGHRESRIYRSEDINKDVLILPSMTSELINLQDLPKDFDWLSYRNLNPDLHYLKTYEDAVRHYLQYGIRENRPYKRIQSTPCKTVNETGNIKNLVRAPNSTLNRTIISIQPSSNPHLYLPSSSSFTASPASPASPASTSPTSPTSSALSTLSTLSTTSTLPMPLASPCPTPLPLDSLPPNFNWIWYRLHYSDLKDKIKTKDEAIQHYLTYGIKEGRKPGPDQLKISTKLSKTKPTGLQIPSFRPIDTINQNNKHKKHLDHNTRKHSPFICPEHVSHKKISKLSNVLPGTIPNVIHFIYGLDPSSSQKPFKLTHYLAIKSAYEVNRPDKIYFHYQYEPNGPWWDRIKPYLILDQLTAPDQIYDKKIRHYAHKADILRLKILNAQGGIYLDIDTICLKPFHSLLKYDFVMGIQGDNYGLCNAVILSKPNTQFGQKWLETYQTFNHNQWDTHSVHIPYQLSKSIPITVLPNDAFFWPLWDPIKELLLSEPINYDCCHRLFRNSYCVHLWDTWNNRYLSQITEDQITTYHSLYNVISHKFLSNELTFVLILGGFCVSDDTGQSIIKMIGSYYKILNEDYITNFQIYDLGIKQSNLKTYLDQLSNINSKFNVTQLESQNLMECLNHIMNNISHGIIGILNPTACFRDVRLINLIVQRLYDESVGMIGFDGGYLFKTKGLYPISKTPEMSSEVSVDYITGCMFFRSELKHYKINLDHNMKTLSMIDLCCQIRQLGKQLLTIPNKSMEQQTESHDQICKEQWMLFYEKWKKLKSVKE